MFWEHSEPELNFQVAKIENYCRYELHLQKNLFVKIEYLKYGTWCCHEIKKFINCTSKGYIFRGYHFLERTTFKMNKNDRRMMFEVLLITFSSAYWNVKWRWLTEKEGNNKSNIEPIYVKVFSNAFSSKSPELWSLSP